MIVIVNYGLGNINAFVNIFKKLDVPIKIANSVEELDGATKLILPGVGAFDHAMMKLENSGMRGKLDDLILNHKIPVIGICVGMQILAKSSEEGTLLGLGYIDAEVKKFDVNKISYSTRLPHMGWNDVNPLKHEGLFADVPENPVYYFLHSYYFNCNDKSNILALSNYGGDFVCAVNSKNIFGVQFHPEKSHEYGIKLLSNFANLL